MSQELKLLRLRESVSGASDADQAPAAAGLLLEIWQPAGWQAVALDAPFQHAFLSEPSASGYEVASVDPSLQSADSDVEKVTGVGELTFEPEDRILVLLPGSWVWSGLEDVPRAARRQSSAVGYMVEDQMAEDVEDLHFICEPVQGDLCSVMAISTDKLSALKSQAERLDWPVTAAIPEYRFPAIGSDDSVIWLDQNYAHFWQSSGQGLTVNRSLAGVIAESLFVASDAAEPENTAGAEGTSDSAESHGMSIRILGEPTALELATFQQLGSVEVEAETQLLRALPQVVPGNLLTDGYQVSLQSAAGPWWKKPAIAVAACFILQLVFFVGAGTYYKLQASTADEAAKNLFGEIFPNDRPSADLRRQVTGYLNQASGGDAEFAGQLQQLGQVWSTGKAGDLKLQSLRFDGNRGELVLQLRAANLGQLDTVVGKLSNGQFKAELLAANELEDGVSGRIRLR